MVTLVHKRNKVGHTIEFNYDIEENITLHFLDVMLHSVKSNLKLSVHRKSTNTNDVINLYTYQDNKIKYEIIMEFYLTTLRICNLQYLHKEDKYIEHTFKVLQYSNNVIFNGKQKAHEIF